MAKTSSLRRLGRGRRTVRALIALAALLGMVLGVTSPAAADGSHFSVDFAAAEPTSYDHNTGVGGAFNDGTINEDVVESLEGGDFACGETVVFFAAIDVDEAETEEHTVEFDFSFLAQSTGQDGVGFDSITSVSANTGDSGHVTDGDEDVTLLEQAGGHPGPENLTGTVEITNLGVGDEQFILRIETLLGCTPGESPTGNLQAALTDGRVTEPTEDGINTGNQTIPFMQAGEIAQPGYTLAKTADPGGPVNAGGQIGFDIVLTNTGNVPLTEVTLSDTLPGGLDWAEDPDNPACDIDGSLLTCDFGEVEVGGTRTVSVVATTTDQSCGALENTVEASTGNAGTQTASAGVTVLCPTIDISKSATDDTVDAGGPIGFDIVVTVGGEGAATDVEVSDTLPTLPSGGTWTLNPAVEGCAIAGQELSCSFDSLDAGTVVTLHVEAPTTEVDCDTFDNTASVTTGNDGSDDDGASVTVQCPDLAVDKTAAGGTVDAGDTIGFTVTVSNAGPGTASGVTLEDALPTGDAIDWSVAGTEGVDAGCAITDDDLACGPVDLAAGESFGVVVESPTEFASCAVYDNTAVADADNHGEVTSTASTEVECPDLEVDKTADGDKVDAGDDIGFMITLTNNGPGAATGVVLTDELPTGPGIDWSGTADTADVCVFDDTTLTCELDELAAGEQLRVHVSSPTTEEACAAYENVVEVDAANHGAVESSASTEVVCPEEPPPTTAPPTRGGPPLPRTGSDVWPLVGLAVLLIAGGSAGLLLSRRDGGWPSGGRV